MVKRTAITVGLTLAVAGFVGHLARPAASMDPFVGGTPIPPPLSKSDNSQIFGHPVVADGIHTYDELVANAEWYDGLNLEDARFTQTQVGGFAYVSYMKNGKMYWTRMPRYIRAGEPIILSDGMIILQRCGNEVRFTAPPMSETLPSEPDDLYPPDTVPGDIVGPRVDAPPSYTELVIPPVDVAPPLNGSPATFAFVPPVFPPSSKVVNVDEPNTGLLLGFGLSILIALGWRF